MVALDVGPDTEDRDQADCRENQPSGMSDVWVRPQRNGDKPHGRETECDPRDRLLPRTPVAGRRELDADTAENDPPQEPEMGPETCCRVRPG